MNTAVQIPVPTEELDWVCLGTVQCPHCKQMAMKIYQARTDPQSALNQASKYECTGKGCPHPLEVSDPRIAR